MGSGELEEEEEEEDLFVYHNTTEGPKVWVQRLGVKDVEDQRLRV